MTPKKVLYGGIFASSVVAGIFSELAFPGYGKDAMYGVQSYSACRFVGFDLKPLECAAVSFVGNSLGEFAQLFGLFPGTFDPKDFIAYTLGAAISFNIESFLRRHQERGLEKKLKLDTGILK